ACYGSPCALTIITLPDGGRTAATDECGQRYDCATPTLPNHIRAICDGTAGGVDGGAGPGADGGLTDADAGP
ncbi:MAG: hypothetical protein JNG84_09940, partial [Archangium sp.]|nr:hypothetical protein [Archangium sp.]